MSILKLILFWPGRARFGFMGCQNWTSPDQLWLCKWWPGPASRSKENSLGEKLRPSFISLGCKGLTECLSTAASSKERQWETPNPHLSYALGLSVSFKVAFWCLALWGMNPGLSSTWDHTRNVPLLFWENGVSPGSCILPLFCLSWLSQHPDLALCWNSKSPCQKADWGMLTLSLWNSYISKSVFHPSPVTQRVRSCHILPMFCFPRQWGSWFASAPCPHCCLPLQLIPPTWCR